VTAGPNPAGLGIADIAPAGLDIADTDLAGSDIADIDLADSDIVGIGLVGIPYWDCKSGLPQQSRARNQSLLRKGKISVR
jgi:hypothetical protein